MQFHCFSEAVYCCVRMSPTYIFCHLLIHWWPHRWIAVWPAVNYVAINMGELLSLWPLDFIFFSCTPSNSSVRLENSFNLLVLKKLPCCFHVAALIYKSCLFSTPLWELHLILYSNSHSSKCEVIERCGFNWRLPNDCWSPAFAHLPVGHLYVTSSSSFPLPFCSSSSSLIFLFHDPSYMILLRTLQICHPFILD